MDTVFKKITAESFWNNFQHKVNEHIRDIHKKWKTRSEFTDLILKEISNKVLEDVEYEKKHQYEYLKIDLIGWNALDNNLGVQPDNFNRHLWAFDVAIEHENDKTDWMDEVIKLSYINCPLRIVIGYAPKENRDSYLIYVSNALNILNKRYRSIRKEQEFMLILGDSDVEGKDVSADTYTPYLYDCNALYDSNAFIDKKNDWMQKE